LIILFFTLLIQDGEQISCQKPTKLAVLNWKGKAILPTVLTLLKEGRLSRILGGVVASSVLDRGKHLNAHSFLAVIIPLQRKLIADLPGIVAKHMFDFFKARKVSIMGGTAVQASSLFEVLADFVRVAVVAGLPLMVRCAQRSATTP
jgi:hypothetical protein